MKEGSETDFSKANIADLDFLLGEIEHLIKNHPVPGGNEGIWWGRANYVINEWDASKPGAVLAAQNLYNTGRGASERLNGLQTMISLLTQANLALRRRSTMKALEREREKPISRKVFIVHGHDAGTRNTVARFLQQMEFEPIILHEQPNQGKTIIEKFEAHSDVGFAVVLLTPDDEGRKKGAEPPTILQLRARQNVILELGYFIGCLGRDKVCALKVGDLVMPSDILGVLWVTFDSGQWKQDLAKELQAAGFTIDWNRVMGLR